ncbi:hypothetical protein ACOSQ4_005134 [Xanthoceras sorbifolium]
MEPKAKLKTVIITLFLTILVQYSCSAHSRKLASTSPSPAPVSEEPLFIRRKEKKRRGSMPASCHGMCNQCIPCLPVEVSIRTMESDENQYYPQVSGSEGLWSVGLSVGAPVIAPAGISGGLLAGPSVPG